MALQITDSNFEDTVLKSDKPVLVDFWAEWCGPCRAIGPVIEELSKEYDGKVKVGKVNVDENPQVSMNYGITSIPAILFVKNGQVSLIGTNESRRSPQEPDVPAIAEVIPGFDFSVAIGALARAGTSPEAIKRLAEDIAWAVKQHDVIEKFNGVSISGVGVGPEAYRKEIDRENQAMAKAGRQADLKAE